MSPPVAVDELTPATLPAIVMRVIAATVALLAFLVAGSIFIHDRRANRELKAQLAQHEKLYNNMGALRGALFIYRTEFGAYPSSEIGLSVPEVLVPRVDEWNQVSSRSSSDHAAGLADPFRAGTPIIYVSDGHGYLLVSAGPDGSVDASLLGVLVVSTPSTVTIEQYARYQYDPTNGIHSQGDILAISPEIGVSDARFIHDMIWTRILRAPDLDPPILFGDPWR